MCTFWCGAGFGDDTNLDDVPDAEVYEAPRSDRKQVRADMPAATCFYHHDFCQSLTSSQREGSMWIYPVFV